MSKDKIITYLALIICITANAQSDKVNEIQRDYSYAEVEWRKDVDNKLGQLQAITVRLFNLSKDVENLNARLNSSSTYVLFLGAYDNTGMFRPSGLNEVAFSAQGVERFRIGISRNTHTVPIKPASYTVATLPTGAEGDVGAYKYLDNNGDVATYRDTKDTLDLTMIVNDSYAGSFYDSVSSIPFPTVPENTRPVNFYDSNPHIPEAWLTANGITGSANIHNEVQVSGYTLLEEYINQVDN